MKKNIYQLKKELMNGIMEANVEAVFGDWDENEIEIIGSENEFHNYATELARYGCYNRACDALLQGINLYPYDTDLLADFLMYGMNCGNLHKCSEIFKKLDSMDDRKKTWRAYAFSIDYVIHMISMSDGEKLEEWKTKALSIVDRYKNRYPRDEAAYLCEYKIYEACAEDDKGIQILEAFINTKDRVVKVAPRCHLKVVDKMLERGEYEKVILYSANGAAEAAEEQESVDTGFFFYALALAKDALWLKAEKGKPAPDKERAEDILLLYQTAYDTLDENKTSYFNMIRKRFRIISNIAHIEKVLNEWRYASCG